jgi:hypothetical protein
MSLDNILSVFDNSHDPGTLNLRIHRLHMYHQLDLPGIGLKSYPRTEITRVTNNLSMESGSHKRCQCGELRSALQLKVDIQPR